MGLDLSRIEAWTRGMLEAEARRRKIRSPEFRTRSELVRLILRDQYGDQLSAGRERIAQGVRAWEQARGLLSSAVQGALSVIPEPVDRLLGLRTPARQPRPEATEQPQPRRASAPQPREWQAPENTRTPPEQPEHTPAQTAPQSPVAQSQPVAPSTRTFVEEPIRTHSMARLLAAQGHRERALAIYEELLAHNSEDETLRHEAEALRQGRAIEPPVLPDPPVEIERVALPESGDRLSCEGEPRSGLQLRWHITDDGQRRARAVLGSAGELAVRLVAIRPDPEQVVRSEITEHGPVSPDGTWQSPVLTDAARCFAAVGLREGDHFVAIVHAHPGAARDVRAGDRARPAAG